MVALALHGSDFVTIISLSGATAAVECNCTHDTIEVFKRKVEAHTGIATNKQRLVIGGAELKEPHKTLRARSRVRYSTGVKLRCQMVQNQGRGIEASVGTVPVPVGYRYWYGILPMVPYGTGTAVGRKCEFLISCYIVDTT